MYTNTIAIENIKEFITNRRKKKTLKHLIKDWYLITNQNIGNLHIINFRFKFRRKSITIIIYLEHPGLLYGKGGSNMIRLQEHLSKMMRKNITIIPIHSSVWL